MPIVHKGSDATDIKVKWDIFERIAVGVIIAYAGTLGVALAGVFLDNAVTKTIVQRHDEILKEGRRYTAEDAIADRSDRAVYEAAILDSTMEIRTQGSELVEALATITAMLEQMRQLERDAREERRAIDARLRELEKAQP